MLKRFTLPLAVAMAIAPGMVLAQTSGPRPSGPEQPPRSASPEDEDGGGDRASMRQMMRQMMEEMMREGPRQQGGREMPPDAATGRGGPDRDMDGRRAQMREERAGQRGFAQARRGGMGPRGFHAAQMKMAFAIVDADGDGALTIDEINDFHARIFNAVDQDGDGGVTMEEIEAFFHGSQDRGSDR